MSVIPIEKIFECTHMFMSTDRTRRRCFDRELKSMGIHHTQHRVLMYIEHHEGIINQKQIAENFDVSPAAVVGTIKKLESNGYITRCSSEKDNRFNEIKITEKGKKIIEETHSAFEALDRKTFECFNEEEIDQLIYLLGKMKKSLKEKERS
ncbi:MAG: MarR family winged helix-turn-helix transcriptional regulator [Acutalibacteraceae bacterium]